MSKPLRPRWLRLDAAPICQLRCPTCPTAGGEIGRRLGTATLKPQQFEQLLRQNPWVRQVELSNWGEIFLNPQLLEIMEIAHRFEVELSADNGVNFNHVSEAVLEGLVRFRFRRLNCSIDGATQEVYEQYRRKGDLNRVLGHLRRLQEIKRSAGSPYPELQWQFVAFQHNLHEIDRARELAEELGMEFFLKLSWEDLYSETAYSPVRDAEELRRQHPQGVASREEFRDKMGREYLKGVCLQLWHQPQVHSDGRMLGCCVNSSMDYGNVFQDGLEEVLNGPRLEHARRMLLGQAKARPDVACSQCQVYRAMCSQGRFLSEEEVLTT